MKTPLISEAEMPNRRIHRTVTAPTEPTRAATGEPRELVETSAKANRAPAGRTTFSA
jgi:hypothetical protein